MDYFARIGEQRANNLSKEYSNKYQTYNCISSVLDSIETQKGGLYPVEVWSEVLRLEDELKTAPRRDKFIAEQRTRLENKYRKIVINKAGDSIDRTKEDAERSVMCVLLALAMHLLACPDDKPNPHTFLIRRIYKMVLEYDPELTIAIAEAYNSGEDEEEAAGFLVQPHDPLEDDEKPQIPAELQALKERTEEIFDFYSNTLANTPGCLSSNYTQDDFFDIWDDLSNEITIIKQMQETSPRIKITLKDDLPEKNTVSQSDYNLKLVLNIIGLMRESGIVTKTTEQLNSMFFTDVKTKYFKLNEIEKVGTSDSGIKDETMLELIRKIIKQHTKQSGSVPDTSPILHQ
jgi:hypothetical protein